MKFLSNIIKEFNEYKVISTSLNRKGANCCCGLSSVHKANLIYALCKEKNCKSLVLVSDESEAQTLANDICCMGGKALVYPVRDFNFRDVSTKSNEYEHKRLKVLSKIISGDFTCVIATVDAACQLTIPKDVLNNRTLKFSSGGAMLLEDAISTLSILGYERCDLVEGSGQFAVRGGILDFFMPDSENPVRAEFWGDEIDTLNYFDIETQRRTDYIEELSLMPSTETLIENRDVLAEKIEYKASLLKGKSTEKAKQILLKESDNLKHLLTPSNKDKFINLIYDKPDTLFDYFTDNDIIFVSEQKKASERLRVYNKIFNEELKDCFDKGILCKGFDTYHIDSPSYLYNLSNSKTVFLETFTPSKCDVPLKELVTFSVKQSSIWSGSFKVLNEELQSLNIKESKIVILAGTEKTADSITAQLNDNGYFAQYKEDFDNITTNKIHVVSGSLSSSFEYPDLNFTLITHGQIFSSYKKTKPRKRPKNSQEIYSLSELSSGDYVVHITHGIGIFCGIHKIDVQGIVKDYIKLEYAKKDALYVPVTQLDLISKYIGPRENSAVKIHKLGSGDWQKAKNRVRASVKDMAKELTVLYAKRMNAKGFAFTEDREWQRDFDSHFEYQETDDQLRCIDEIKGDMTSTHPMDRLLCGDVGFGKTEVALRAAFKCVADSKQCAFLCPTTILAWQHYQTVLKRFEDYPVRIELLSRFRTKKQQTEIIKRLKEGQIDLIIGTHRLVQKDIEFYDLGLCIIDEEQRFGVAHKEKFKELKENVDILTLSATPIPRTLNMAMSGVRDMSVLEEAPQDRRPVQTYVLEHDSGVISQAIKKELRRGGQVFYLFNNVENISLKASAIQGLVPEAKIGIGHGRMTEKELSDVWKDMLDNEINVLICTTIIETGVDLPNANTLIIENADHMGLSQLHQLRGRVGRSSRRAYAYFTYQPQKTLTEISQKRLTAIREFTQFGSGFKIAMRDLQLRGAGNILGGNQHGHMEDVGYDMYLKLLANAVSEEKGEPISNDALECLVDVRIQAHIPDRYIENLSQRLDVYRKISDIRNQADARDVVDELIDRFGDVPQSVLGLVKVALVRSSAAQIGIYEIKQTGNKFFLYLNTIKSPAVAELASRLKNNCSLKLTEKPHLLVTTSPNLKPIESLNLIFNLK